MAIPRCRWRHWPITRVGILRFLSSTSQLHCLAFKRSMGLTLTTASVLARKYTFIAGTRARTRV